MTPPVKPHYVKLKSQKVDVPQINADYYCFTEKIPKCFKDVKGIYVFVKDDEIVYVGMSENLYQRVNKYFVYRLERFDFVAVIPLDRKYLFKLESAFISKLSPKFNRGIGKSVDFWA